MHIVLHSACSLSGPKKYLPLQKKTKKNKRCPNISSGASFKERKSEAQTLARAGGLNRISCCSKWRPRRRNLTKLRTSGAETNSPFTVSAVTEQITVCKNMKTIHVIARLRDTVLFFSFHFRLCSGTLTLKQIFRKKKGKTVVFLIYNFANVLMSNMLHKVERFFCLDKLSLERQNKRKQQLLGGLREGGGV